MTDTLPELPISIIGCTIILPKISAERDFYAKIDGSPAQTIFEGAIGSS